MKDNRKFAIYSRKSKFTGKGESIGNQIELCRQYLSIKNPGITDEDIIVFEDEGFSGGNTNRPQFLDMINRCRNKEIEQVICYRLDRLSRNTGDFIKLIEELERLKVKFISIRDDFDTNSPTGRAMMLMCSVFSQLERETIAERIRDNMQELSKTGRWLGGTPPTGYQSVETVGSVTVDGKTRKARKLEIIKEEAEIVKLIYAKFLEFNSLTKTETYLINNDIFTKNNKNFTRFALKTILTNPVYMIADESSWNYFENQGLEIYADKTDFDGKHGIMSYNKTNQKSGSKHELNDISEWIISVGKHKGIISSNDWIAVQKLLTQNKSKSYRKPKSTVALLSGMIYCGNCDSYMRPKLSQRKNKDGELIYDYLCELKERSQSQKCDMKRPNGNELDRILCEEIKRLSENSSDFIRSLKKERKNLITTNESYEEKMTTLRTSQKEYEEKIANLVKILSQTADTSSNSYILKEISTLDEKLVSIQTQIQEYEDLAKTTTTSDDEFEILVDMLTSFSKTFDLMSIEQKRSAIHSFVRKIVWDGENVHIYFFGENEDEIDLSDIDKSEPQRMGCK